MTQPLALTVPIRFECPTEGCSEAFEAVFVLGHASTESYNLPRPAKAGASCPCPHCGRAVLVAPMQEITVKVARVEA